MKVDNLGSKVIDTFRFFVTINSIGFPMITVMIFLWVANDLISLKGVDSQWLWLFRVYGFASMFFILHFYFLLMKVNYFAFKEDKE